MFSRIIFLICELLQCVSSCEELLMLSTRKKEISCFIWYQNTIQFIPLLPGKIAFNIEFLIMLFGRKFSCLLFLNPMQCFKLTITQQWHKQQQCIQLIHFLSMELKSASLVYMCTNSQDWCMGIDNCYSSINEGAQRYKVN